MGKHRDFKTVDGIRLPGRGLPVLLSGPGEAAETPLDAAVHRSGAQLRALKVAVSGSWVKQRPFSITHTDLRRMAANFEKRKNDMVVIDYEHASENPDVAMGGPVPAAGWIHRLTVEGIEPEALLALVEWTPEAEQMIRNGEYRFFSPAIDWSAADKDTGEPQGATLTSGALTNHPFLEELPPIMLSDGRIVAAASDPSRGRHRTISQREGDETMKKLSLRPVPDGEEQAGNHAVYEEDGREPLGFIPHSELAQYAAEHLGANPDDQQAERTAEDQGAAKVEASAARRRALFLKEVASQGRIDSARASELAQTGQISLAEYIQAQEAEKLIESAVASGKVLPRHRAFFFRDALERPAEFMEYAKNAPPVVQLGSRGIGSGEALPVDEEIHLGVKRLMDERGLDYAKALKAFLSSNPSLGAQYHAKHAGRLNADGTAG